jgi:hypothetical protein
MILSRGGGFARPWQEQGDSPAVCREITPPAAAGMDWPADRSAPASGLTEGAAMGSDATVRERHSGVVTWGESAWLGVTRACPWVAFGADFSFEDGFFVRAWQQGWSAWPEEEWPFSQQQQLPAWDFGVCSEPVRRGDKGALPGQQQSNRGTPANSVAAAVSHTRQVRSVFRRSRINISGLFYPASASPAKANCWLRKARFVSRQGYGRGTGIHPNPHITVRCNATKRKSLSPAHP